MCKWNKWGDTRIDPCMRNIIKVLNFHGIKTFACCCGHKKYSPTIVCEWGEYILEIFSNKYIPRKKKFYKRDKQGYYYIPEVINGKS